MNRAERRRAERARRGDDRQRIQRGREQLGAGFALMEPLWLEFAKRIGAATFGDTQYREMRRAFYAGAAGIFDMLTHPTGGLSPAGGLDPGLDETDRDLAKLDILAAEFQAFGEALKGGRS